MSITFSPRAGAALGIATLSLLALAACEKPSPLAQVTVGDRTASAEAVCYNDGKTIEEAELKNCSGKAKAHITVGQGDKLRIGVDPKVAEHGWVLVLNGQEVTEPSKKTYVSYNGESFFTQMGQDGQPQGSTDKATLTIASKDGQDLRGVWSIDLKRDKS